MCKKLSPQYFVSFVLIAAMVLLLAANVGSAGAERLTAKERLGKLLFFDRNLSEPPGQSCAACHAPEVGWTGPDPMINIGGAVYPGAVPGRFGNRKPPSSAYGGYSDVLNMMDSMFVGGMFWDGRATGWTLGDPLAEQAMGPFLNPLEQNNPSKEAVVMKVKDSCYASLFIHVWGRHAFDKVERAYEYIARSIAAYERSKEVSPFCSKYDAYLTGNAELTRKEKLGLELFEGKAKCSLCHISQPGPDGAPPLFTDYTYDNLGIPKNPLNPFYMMPPEYNPDGYDWIDPGLGGFLETTAGEKPDYSMYAEENYGKHKVPTLRNVDKRPYPCFVKAYGHNGHFKSLKEIVHFYNTRDVKPWPEPEVPYNINNTELGALGLTKAEEDAIVTFLKTLTDRYRHSWCMHKFEYNE